MQDFTSLFLEFSKDFESPTSFWKWSSYALIAATLRDNVFHNQGNEIICPNIYVILLADSAVFRKGGSFPIISELIETLHHTKLFDGRASIQALMERLSVDLGGKKGIPIRGGSCLLLAEELSSFFVYDPQLIPLMTNLYRSRKTFNYELRGNAFTIKDLCVTLLGASNETLLREIFDIKATEGGLLGRTFVIKPDKKRPANDLLEIDLARYNKKPLINSLEEIKKLKGPITFTKPAARRYKEWYKELYESLEKTYDPTGMLGRIHTSVLKLCMIQAASNYRLEITEEDVVTSIEDAICLKPNYEAFAMSSGMSNQAKIGSIFLKALWETSILNGNNGNKMSRKIFLQNFWNQMSAEDLDKVTQTLVQGGLVTEDYTGNDLGYIMTQKCREKFEGKLKGKKQNP